MEYNTIFFGDVAKIKNGYAFKSKEFQEKGIPVIKIKNIISPIVDTKDSQKVSIKTYEKTKGFSLKKNDILISLTGSGVNQMSSAVGKVGRIEFDYPALQNQRVGKFELKYSNSADLDFLFYYFLQPKITEYLVRNSTGSANQANINSKLIETVKIPNFSLIKQKSISKFLNQITRKIETNQKMIANLKELSQTLFKHWFVDFEFPDEDGNPYKSSGGEMIDSELGKIPSNWKIYKLKDIASHKKETFNPKKSEEVTVKHFSLPAYDRDKKENYFDDEYDSAIDWLLKNTREDYMTAQHNMEYGFYRNLLGIKYIGIIIVLISIVFSIVVFILSQENVTIQLVLSSIINVFFLYFWIFKVTKTQTRKSAKRYAQSLLANCDFKS